MDISQLVLSSEERIVALEVDEQGAVNYFRRQSEELVHSENTALSALAIVFRPNCRTTGKV